MCDKCPGVKESFSRQETSDIPVLACENEAPVNSEAQRVFGTSSQKFCENLVHLAKQAAGAEQSKA